MADVSPVDRGRLLSEFAEILARIPTDRPQTWRLGEALRQRLRAEGVAVTVEYLSENRTTLCVSDDAAAALETLQEVAGEGPGFEASRHDAIVVVDLDEEADRRWPMLAHALEDRFRGLRVYAIPLQSGIAFAGVATLHTAHGQALAVPLDRVAYLANVVGAALLADAPGQDDEESGDGEGWSSRAAVHQATGMVMAQVRAGPEDALALLRAHAYARDSDINDVAAGVIDRSIDFTNFDVRGD